MRPPYTDPALLQDWATILASEAAAVAADREIQEAVLRTARLVEATLQDTADALRRAGADAAPGPAPTLAASDAGGRDVGGGSAAELADLRRRIAILEQRLAERG